MGGGRGAGEEKLLYTKRENTHRKAVAGSDNGSLLVGWDRSVFRYGMEGAPKVAL